MNFKIIKYGCIFLSVICIICCQKKDETVTPVPPVPPPVPPSEERFLATIDDASGNTTLGDTGKVLWEKGDTIIINWKKYVSDRSGAQAYFDKIEEAATGDEFDAWYPASLCHDSVTELPAIQKYEEGKICNCPMHAHSTSTILNFKNLCGVFAISVKGHDDARVTKIEMTSNKAMSGVFTVVDDAAVLTEEALTSGKGVTLDCGDNASLSYIGRKFYIAVPPGDYTNLSLKLTVSDGEKDTTYTLSKTVATITRNTIYSSSFDTRGFPVEMKFADSYKLSIVDDYIVNLGTLTVSASGIPEDYFSAPAYGNESERKGLCSAGGNITSTGELIIGRNYDMPLSYNPVYIFQTKGGKYRTLNAMYYQEAQIGSKTFQQIEKGDRPSQSFVNNLPYVSFDVFNEKGFYIELNMRYRESQFANSGTNPGKKPVATLHLPQKLATNCASVEEAVAMARNDISIYDGIGYVLGCLIGDASGNYGVLEAIGNKIYFSKDSASSNFWVPAEIRSKEEYREGIGRGDVMRECLPSIENDSMMFALMDRLAYSNIYADAFKERSEWRYDIRSDYTEMFKPMKPTDWLIDDANFKEVSKVMQNYAQTYVNMTDAERRDCRDYWMPTIITVVNCTRKSIIFQYAQDTSKRYTFHW